MDPRQMVAGVLTVTMFVMLGNMIKNDHFDSLPVISLTLFYYCNFFFSFAVINLF